VQGDCVGWHDSGSYATGHLSGCFALRENPTTTARVYAFPRIPNISAGTSPRNTSVCNGWPGWTA
jgi:hypothetical protein